MTGTERALHISYDRLDDLIRRGRPENPKRHDLPAIGASVKRVGYIDPPTVNDSDGLLLAGHGRIELLAALRARGAARPVGIAVDAAGMWLVPVIHGVALSLADARAYLIADNRTTELGGWDPEQLVAVLRDVAADAQGLVGVGYSVQQLADLVAGIEVQPETGLTDPDAVPPEADELYVAPGELWALGDHRLLCGDGTSAGDLAQLLQGERAASCPTDPPWNVAIGQDSNPRHRQRPGLLNDHLPEAEFAAFLQRFATTLRPVLDGDLYCVLGAAQWPLLDGVLRDAGYHWSATLIWVKQQFVLGRSQYHRRYEPIWYGWPDDGRSSYHGGRSQDDVWEFDRPLQSPDHPTQKPVALIERMIANSSRPGEIVLDPFLGSGTALLASERLGRRCRGVELDPRYAQLVIERWQQFTGHTATRLAVR